MVAIFVGTGLGLGLGLAAAKAVTTVQRIRSSDWSCMADVRYAFCGRKVERVMKTRMHVCETWEICVESNSAFILTR